MTNDILYNLLFKIGGDNKILSAIGKIQAGMDKTQKSVDGVVNSISRKLNAIHLNAVLDQINRVSSGLEGLSKPGLDLSTSMFDLQAITGVAGDKLKEIEGYARASAKTFGGDAASAVESYKLVLSQLSPEIAKSPAALKDMGNSIATLSKTMGGDTVAATETLTTAMNQFGISTDDPIAASKVMANMMNVMAAGAKEGSAELPQIKAALEQAGMAAKGANVSFEETNAAIQVLDKAGKKGAEGGVALRNALAIMGQGRFLPPQTQKALKAAGVDMGVLGNNAIPLANRLKALNPIMNDGALLTKLFGMENQNAARALISGVPEINRLTTAITGTNTAYEQAAIVMESPAEKNKRLQASVDDLKISLFNGTNGWLGYMGVISNITFTVTNLIPLFTTMSKVTKLWTGAQWALNVAMDANPIGLIIAAVAAVIGVVVLAIKKWDEWGAALVLITGPLGIIVNAIMSIKTHWDSIVNAFKSDGLIGGLKRIGTVLSDVILKPFQQILELIAKIPGSIGNAAGQAAETIKRYRGENNLLSAAEKAAMNNAAFVNGAAIAPPSILPPGATGTGGKNGKTGNATKNTNDAIATGGTKSTNIHITIGNQVHTLKIEAGSFEEGVTKMRDRLMDEMTRAVEMGAALGGGNNG